MVWYEDQYFWYVWKPHGLASSWGESFCLLDKLLDHHSGSVREQSTIDTRLGELIASGYDIFGKERELGLVNRLDNDTAGLLYFAKSAEVFSHYKNLQQEGKVVKHYVAEVLGDMDDARLVCTPILHHKHLSDRMVTRRGPQDDGKVRGKKHLVETYIEPLLYDQTKNTTTVAVTIAAGIRHQIRVHCASIGSSIVGDTLYGKEKKGELCLWCLGMNIG